MTESWIDGTFRCWDGDTIFVLANEEVWQQRGYSTRYCERYNPRVTIFLGDYGYQMSVEGVGTVDVRRMR